MDTPDAFVAVAAATFEVGDLESIRSRTVFSSSSAVSHFPVKISDASFPQCAEVVRSGSVERMQK